MPYPENINDTELLMLTKLIMILGLILSQDMTTQKQHVTAEPSAPNTTVIYKSDDSQGVDVIWLAACIKAGCGPDLP